jgi:tetratricopeptide (TPR) repeat protein
MGMNRSSRAVVLVGLLVGLPAYRSYAQFDAMMFEHKPPQAQSRVELYEFLDLVDNAKSAEFLALTNLFMERFPRSEFRGFVHRMRMNAYQEMNDYHNTVEAAQKALELNEQDIDVLLTLANVLAHGVQSNHPSSVTLNAAEGYARRALEEIMALKAPRTLSLDDWEKTATAMRASAHCALGLIALKRARYADSVAAFEICTRENPKAAGPQYYLFGVALLENNKVDQARSALKRAAELGPEVVKAQARAQLRSLENK